MIANEWIVDRLVLPDRVQAGARVAAIDGRVVAIDRAAAGPTAERLRGTLLPGFVDLQCNGAGGHSVDEATPAALEAVARAVWRGGAVAFLPTLITAPWQQLLAQVAAVSRWIRSRKPSADAAEPLGIHLEGPFLTAPGAHDPSCFLDPTPARIAEVLDAAAGQLRLVTLACARPGAAAAVAQLGAAGVRTAIGHCAEVTGLRECVGAGATAVTHLFNVMGPMHHREPNLAMAALDDERLSCGLIVDGAHVQPAVVRHAYRILGPDRTILVTDAVAAAGMPDGEYALAGIRVTARDGVVRDAEGRLAGSALTMAAAARNFLSLVPTAGAWTLSRIASHNPARFVGPDRFGSIAVGQPAAFALLGDDGSIRCVTP